MSLTYEVTKVQYTVKSRPWAVDVKKDGITIVRYVGYPTRKAAQEDADEYNALAKNIRARED